MTTMDRPELTAWIDGDATPEREGVYERRSPAGAYSCWDGRAWHADAASPVEAAQETGESRQQALAWRGLAAPSAAPCATCGGHTVVDRGFDEGADVDRFEECVDC